MSSDAGAVELVVGTVAAKNHLPRVRVLAESLRRVHPEVGLVLLLMDEPEGLFDPAAEPFEVLLLGDLEDLAGPDLGAVAFRYSRRAAASAAKPGLLRHLLARGHRSALHLDSDTVVVGDLAPVARAVRDHDVVLTPHLLAPAADPAAAARELAIGRAGIVNGGVVGARAGAAADGFLAWWSERVLAHCVDDVARGLHYDQRWLDLAIGPFEGVHLLRDPGVNVAYWNLHERPLRIEDGRITAGGHPCRVLHASGYDVAQPGRLSMYSLALTTDGQHGDLARLLDRYRRALLVAGEAEAGSWPWAFDRWADGLPIDPAAREAHRALGQDAARLGDPFAVGAGSFREWLQPAGTATVAAGRES